METYIIKYQTGDIETPAFHRLAANDKIEARYIFMALWHDAPIIDIK